MPHRAPPPAARSPPRLSHARHEAGTQRRGVATWCQGPVPVTSGAPESSLPAEDDLPDGVLSRVLSRRERPHGIVSIRRRPQGPGHRVPQWRCRGHIPLPVLTPPGTPTSLTSCRLSRLRFFHSLDFSSAVTPTVEPAWPPREPAPAGGRSPHPTRARHFGGHPAASSHAETRRLRELRSVGARAAPSPEIPGASLGNVLMSLRRAARALGRVFSPSSDALRPCCSHTCLLSRCFGLCCAFRGPLPRASQPLTRTCSVRPLLVCLPFLRRLVSV